jgi:solute:Na+ symporter, SSS family
METSPDLVRLGKVTLRFILDTLIRCRYDAGHVAYDDCPFSHPMQLHPLDLSIIAAYLVAMAFIGVLVRKQATKHLDSYYLADRNIPWWMLGLSGCSSYIDVGGTMALVGVLYYLGLKSIWITHIFWGWLMICLYMAFQAKYIRRSGVMTFAEWNETRFGANRDAEFARLAAAIFLLVLMIFNLMYMAVGTGKFVEEFLPFARWQSTLIVFGVVGVYVTLGGFFGVIITDLFQTLLIAIGAVILTVLAFQAEGGTGFAAAKPAGWSALAPTWTLWSGYAAGTPQSYQHYQAFGPILLSGFAWMIFRLLAGPNVWDFQFFLTTRSPRDASLSAGLWTVGYTLRWFLGLAFMVLGLHYFGSQSNFDAEKVMPLVLKKLPIGMQGVFLAVLLAALMSTLSAMINVTSSAVLNDFLKRYFARGRTERQLVRWGQLASAGAIALGFLLSLLFKDVVSAWETMIFVVVTMILVPATCRWHWWRFSARAFVWSMAATALWIGLQKLFFGQWGASLTLAVDTLASLVLTVAIGWLTAPTDREVLVRFYARVRPFGWWGPVRAEAVRRGLVPAGDRMPLVDALNGLITAVFQIALALVPFYLFLKEWRQFWIWCGLLVAVGALLYFTWYRTLPARDEK